MRSRPGTTISSLFFSRPALVVCAALFAVAALFARAASAEEDEGEMKIHGLASVGYTHSFQHTDLPVGGSISDGNGIDALVGFQTGDYLAFQLGMQWQGESDFDTYFFPVTVRAMSPMLLDRVRMYGEFGIGLFFSELHNEFNADDNERGSAYRVGGGFEIGITKDFSALVYSAYQAGFGSTDDYKSTILGVGVQYRWGL